MKEELENISVRRVLYHLCSSYFTSSEDVDEKGFYDNAVTVNFLTLDKPHFCNV